ncbi:VOC family protein [Micromonospora sp. NPDC049523]|uniref:VOC family protein n=1 Tax=Micromonospora sp. NPDC049523 TaxID=3155921 RepID=UPI00342E8EE8
MGVRIQVAFDAADPHALARFWAEALRYQQEDHSALVGQLLDGGQLQEHEVIEVDGRRAFRDVATCTDPDGTGPRLFFQRVPEPKTAKNRVHLDLQVGPEVAKAEVERLLELGATIAWVTSDRGPVNTTLHDPEGNELCVS